MKQKNLELVGFQQLLVKNFTQAEDKAEDSQAQLKTTQ